MYTYVFYIFRKQRKVSFYHLVMNCFLLGVLLSVKGASAAHAQSEQVWAPAGGDVILPCRLKSSSSDDLPTLEWSKKDLDPNVVFLYRDGCETHEMKNEDFEFRTSLFQKELNNGNASLRISNLKPSDAGTYRCLQILKDRTREETVVELDVGPVSPVVVLDLKLHVVSADSGGVTVECRVRCWSPELEMKVLDGEGNDFPGKQREEPGSGGCVLATRRVTLQDPTSRIVCRVYKPMTNQTITAEILTPGSGSGMCSSLIIVFSVLTLCLVPVVLVLFRKECFKSGKKKLSNQSGASEISAMLPDQLLQTTEIENIQNDLIDRLHEEVALLRSQNDAKDKTIHQLQKESSSLPCGVMCRLNQPTIPPSPSKSSLESSETPNPTPDFNSERRKLLPKAVKPSKNIDPKPDKPSKNIDPKADKAKNNHPSPSRPLQKKRRNSSPAHLTSAPPEFKSPVYNRKKDPVVHIRSQSDPVHQFDPNPANQRRSLSGPSSSSSYYNPYSPLAED